MVNTWVEFVKDFEHLQHSNKMGEKTDISNMEGANDDRFFEQVGEAIADAKLFSVDIDTARLLALTKAPNKNSKLMLPFSSMFVNVDFTKEQLNDLGWDVEYGVNGIIINESSLTVAPEYDGVMGWDKDGKEIPVNKRNVLEFGRGIKIIARQKDGGFFEFGQFTIQMDLDENFPLNIRNIETKPKTKKFLQNFVINLLNLINDPEVVIVTQPRSIERDRKRAKRGKPPIPDNHFIKISGERRRYINSLVSSGKMNSGYSWWVRGHWRTLRSPRYGKSQGKRIWILPFIKGEGKLVERRYEVEE